jgi:hypothetical protein
MNSHLNLECLVQPVLLVGLQNQLEILAKHEYDSNDNNGTHGIALDNQVERRRNEHRRGQVCAK